MELALSALIIERVDVSFVVKSHQPEGVRRASRIETMDTSDLFCVGS